jgi:hypothetical protein
MEQKFSKKTEIMNKNRDIRNETSINQIKTTVANIISRQKSSRKKNLRDRV